MTEPAEFIKTIDNHEDWALALRQEHAKFIQEIGDLTLRIGTNLFSLDMAQLPGTPDERDLPEVIEEEINVDYAALDVVVNKAIEAAKQIQFRTLGSEIARTALADEFLPKQD
jgi:D-ribose pyranose/furanose isomerase RbsD